MYIPFFHPGKGTLNNDPRIAKLLKDGIIAPSPIENTYVIYPKYENSPLKLIAHTPKQPTAKETTISKFVSTSNNSSTSTAAPAFTTEFSNSSLMLTTSANVVKDSQSAGSVVSSQKSVAVPSSPQPKLNPVEVAVKSLKGASFTEPNEPYAKQDLDIRRAEKKLVTLETHTIPLAESRAVEPTITTVPVPSLTSAAKTTPQTSPIEETMMKEVTDLTNLPQLFGLLLKNQNTEGMNFERLLLMKTLVGLVRTMGMLQDFIVEAKKTTTLAPTTTTTSTTTTTVPTTTTTTTTTASTTVTEAKTTSTETAPTPKTEATIQSLAQKIPPPPPTESPMDTKAVLPTLPDISPDAKTEERWNKVMSFVHNYVAGMK